MIALTTIPVGFCIGTVEVALPAFSAEIDDAALAGVLLALWAAASGVGGLIFGARQGRRELLDTYLVIGFCSRRMPPADRRIVPALDGAAGAARRRSDRPADHHPQRVDLAGGAMEPAPRHSRG